MPGARERRPSTKPCAAWEASASARRSTPRGASPTSTTCWRASPRRWPPAHGRDGRRPLAPGDPELTRLLLRRLAELDNVRAITVINEIGIQTINSRIDPPAGNRPAQPRLLHRPTDRGGRRHIPRPASDQPGRWPPVHRREPPHQSPRGGELRRRRECGRRPRSVPRICLASLVAGGDRSLVLARNDGTIHAQEPARGQAGAALTVFACGDPSGADGTASVSASPEIVSCRPIPRYPLFAIA